MSKYTQAQRKAFVASWEESNLSKAEFCRQKDLRAKHFYHWCERHGFNKQPNLDILHDSVSQPLFARLSGTPSVKATTTPLVEPLSLEIALPSGVKLKIRGKVNTKIISQLVGALS